MLAVPDPERTGSDMTVVDVSSWAVIRDEPGGRDPNKRWIAEDPDAPRHEHWLWKGRQSTGDGSESAPTDCAEVFVSRIASHLGLPAAVCRFAVCDDEWGVISRNVTPEGFSLHTGAAYLPEVDGYERQTSDSATGKRLGRMRRDLGYTLDSVGSVLGNVAPPPGVEGITAFGVFAGYLMLDALVGNTDRHPGNWALLESDEEGARYLAATYDHGSALGAGLTEENRRSRKPEIFAAKGRANPFAPGKILLVDLAREAVRRTHATVWLPRVAALDSAIVRATLEAPPHRLSDLAARFMESVVLENRRRLCDDYVAED